MRCKWHSNLERIGIRIPNDDEYLIMVIEEIYQKILICKRFFDGREATFTGGNAYFTNRCLKTLFVKLKRIEINGTNPRLFLCMKYIMT